MTRFLYFHGDRASGTIAKNRLKYLKTTSVEFDKVSNDLDALGSNLTAIEGNIVFTVCHATKMGRDPSSRLQDWDESLRSRLLIIAASDGDFQEVDEVASAIKKAGFSAWPCKKKFGELDCCVYWETLMTKLRDAETFQDAKQLLDDGIGVLNGDPVDVKVSAIQGPETIDYVTEKIIPEHFWNAVLILLKAGRIALSTAYEERMSASIQASRLHEQMSRKAWWIESLGAIHQDSVSLLNCPALELKSFVENLFVDADSPVTIEMIQSATAFNQETT